MLCKNLVQQLRRGVEGDTRRYHQTLLLLIFQPAKTIELFILRQAAGLYTVEHIIVEIFHAGLAELLVKDGVSVLQAVEEAVMQLAGQGEFVPGIAAGEHLLHRGLALETAVHPGGVKVSKALFNEQVYHLLDLLHVDSARIGRVGGGQAH